MNKIQIITLPGCGPCNQFKDNIAGIMIEDARVELVDAGRFSQKDLIEIGISGVPHVLVYGDHNLIKSFCAKDKDNNAMTADEFIKKIGE